MTRMITQQAKSASIRDNYGHGKVADFLTEKLADGSALSVVSAYFTIYAYEAMGERLDRIGNARFLFGEPRFIATLDPDKTDKKAFKIEDEGLELANRLQQKEIARRCAEWISDKVEIHSIRQANLLHGKLYPIHDGHREHDLARPSPARASVSRNTIGPPWRGSASFPSARSRLRYSRSWRAMTGYVAAELIKTVLARADNQSAGEALCQESSTT